MSREKTTPLGCPIYGCDGVGRNAGAGMVQCSNHSCDLSISHNLLHFKAWQSLPRPSGAVLDIIAELENIAQFDPPEHTSVVESDLRRWANVLKSTTPPPMEGARELAEEMMERVRCRGGSTNMVPMPPGIVAYFAKRIASLTEMRQEIINTGDCTTCSLYIGTGCRRGMDIERSMCCYHSEYRPPEDGVAQVRECERCKELEAEVATVVNGYLNRPDAPKSKKVLTPELARAAFVNGTGDAAYNPAPQPEQSDAGEYVWVQARDHRSLLVQCGEPTTTQWNSAGESRIGWRKHSVIGATARFSGANCLDGERACTAPNYCDYHKPKEATTPHSGDVRAHVQNLMALRAKHHNALKAGHICWPWGELSPVVDKLVAALGLSESDPTP